MKRLFNRSPHYIIFITLIIAACTFPAYRPQFAAGYEEKGIASWYGPDFHGKPTSSGEIYDMYDLTAAHKLMPLGTIARVKNIGNGRSVVVKINDRGPFVAGRIIDLSYSAANSIDMVREGTTTVEIEVLKWGEILTDFTVQVGAFVVEENAQRLRSRLSRKYPDVYIVLYETNDKRFYRVRVGITKELRDAEELAEALTDEGFATFITRKDMKKTE